MPHLEKISPSRRRKIIGHKGQPYPFFRWNAETEAYEFAIVFNGEGGLRYNVIANRKEWEEYFAILKDAFERSEEPDRPLR